MKNITTVIVNYQTPKLLDEAVRSFKEFYPHIKTVIFDNGSRDESQNTIESLVNHFPYSVEAHYESKNIFHGPALHKALTRIVDTKYCFFLDSDTITMQGGFLEKGVAMLDSHEKNYACGFIVHANKRGFKDPGGIPIAVTPYLLLKTEFYMRFPPFQHHGQPVLSNFEEAQNRGYKILHFPMDEYINHLWRGTASRYGYQLGLKGKIDFLLNKFGL